MPDGAPRVYLVTGASRGIGAAVCAHLQRAGHGVIGACRRPRAATGLHELGVPVVGLDTDDPESIASLPERVASHVDHVDVLVNNAGIKQVPGYSWESSAGPMPHIDQEAIVRVLRTNLVGPILVTQALVPLIASPGGVVVNVSSQLGSLAVGVDIDYAYNASKAALNMATVTMQRDLGARGISAVALDPGWMKTDLAGDEAPLEVDAATSDIADLLGRVDSSFGGTFVDRFGDPVAW